MVDHFDVLQDGWQQVHQHAGVQHGIRFCLLCFLLDSGLLAYIVLSGVRLRSIHEYVSQQLVDAEDWTSKGAVMLVKLGLLPTDAVVSQIKASKELSQLIMLSDTAVCPGTARSESPNTFLHSVDARCHPHGRRPFSGLQERSLPLAETLDEMLIVLVREFADFAGVKG